MSKAAQEAGSTAASFVAILSVVGLAGFVQHGCLTGTHLSEGTRTLGFILALIYLVVLGLILLKVGLLSWYESSWIALFAANGGLLAYCGLLSGSVAGNYQGAVTYTGLVLSFFGTIGVLWYTGVLDFRRDLL